MAHTPQYAALRTLKPPSVDDIAHPLKCLCLDIETGREAETQLYKIGAWRADTGQSFYAQQPFDVAKAHAGLDHLAKGAAFVLGHNITAHDLPILASLYPGLDLLKLPVLDTLTLSPLAFPENPYHSLVKDYKLARDSRNDPVKDALRSFGLFQDQLTAFAKLHSEVPAELACFHFLLADSPNGDYNRMFWAIRGNAKPTLAEARELFRTLANGKACATRLVRLLDEDLELLEWRLPLAYVLAWLRVAGGNSVLPPWVAYQYPLTTRLVAELRDTGCGEQDCSYCKQHHDPRNELQRYFGFSVFRAEPANAEGGSLQEDIVKAGLARQSLLAILPTGGGKSLCYQLPALVRHWRTGSLTVIVSPLQSLMKDQVDNLVKQGVFSAAALSGLLTMPERHDVLEKVRLGDIGILLVSPEQFRNRSFTDAIKSRQIAAWVFDEAHCLSKWGHDFRTDYLYVSRFIRERHGDELPPVACFTATAKPEVIEDLQSHFREVLGIDLALYEGGHKRENLHFEVVPVKKEEKYGLIHVLLEKEIKRTAGGAVVFTARRKSAEEIADFLKDMGWECAYFHARLDPGLKKDVQKSFIEGSLRVIVATNAFGMGVDKPDVRIVIHAEIPGSLENYLQESGRAGRDREDSRCVLLYDEGDVETQFSLAARSRLSRKDIAEILRALRRRAGRVKSDEIVITAGEILADEDMQAEIEAENPDADTKVKTGMAWLERGRFLQRNENRTRVFPASLKVSSVETAEKSVRKLDLSQDMRCKYMAVFTAILNAEADEGISTDRLMLETGLSSDECIRVLQALESCGVLSNDIGLTVLVRKGVKDASQDRLQKARELETHLLELLAELAPDAGLDEWQEMHLRALCQELKVRTGRDIIPDNILTLMRTMARAFGESQAQRAMFDLRKVGLDYLRVRLRREWRNIRKIAELRAAVAGVLLRHFLGLLPASAQGVDLRVECKLGELLQALREDLDLKGHRFNDEAKAMEQGLLYMHDTEVLIVDRGKTVFRSAMTIRLYPEEAKRRFLQADYQPLHEHYQERNFQIHVMQEYARRGLEGLGGALAFVAAYFSWPKQRFVREYFANRRELLELATTEESYRRIVADLRHPLQERLVSEKAENNRLVLAGPGSGKTRVIVHRVAYLLRVLREAADGVIVLAFNRSAAYEVRRRLHELVGDEAYGVTVLTYHALAMRLTGTSLATLAESGAEADFDSILSKSVDLLEGRAEAGADQDELRDRLLRGYRHILVDEYQDIDGRQYALIGALAGRVREDKDAKLSIMAVGDDDQNIYAFRETSVEYIHRFEADYEAKTEYLIENYRSSRHIVEVSNEVISRNPQRLKAKNPVRINFARKDAPPGGRWAKLDGVAQGRVHVLAVPDDGNRQAQVVMDELERLKALDNTADWADFAVLARTHQMLESVRAYCEWRGIPYLLVENGGGSQPELHKTREGRALARVLRHKKLVRNGALARWARRHWSMRNPWADLLRQCVTEIEDSWIAAPIPAWQALEWLYEYGAESKTLRAGHVNLSTVHGAKGREFKHVAIMDGGDWQKGAMAEERRLYYVGMTRARETLTLCEAMQRPNPFTLQLVGSESVLRTRLAEVPPHRKELDRRYKLLGMKDVDLGFAGRKAVAEPVHRAIRALQIGDRLHYAEQDGNRMLYDSRGLAVGKLAKGCELPKGEGLEFTVSAIVGRTKKQSGVEFGKWCRVDEWEVVLCGVSAHG